MRLVLLLFLLLTVASPLPAAPTAPEPSPEERAVAAVFERARTALSERRGADAVSLLSRASVESLEKVRRAARAGDRASLSRLGPAETFAALGLRRYLGPAELRRLTVPAIADHALSEGWLGPNVIAQSRLGPVRVHGDRASALLLVKNKPSPVPADFVREKGEWRVDITGVMKFGGSMLQGLAALAGKTDEAFATDLLDRLEARRGSGVIR